MKKTLTQFLFSIILLAAGHINAQPILVYPPDADICMGTCIQYSASGGNGTYTWSPSVGLSVTTGCCPLACPLNTTIYSIKSGTDSAMVIVNVIPPPVVSITTVSGKLVASCGGLGFCIAYFWFKDGVPTCTNSDTCAPSGPGSYTVTGINNYGCEGASNPYIVTGIEENDISEQFVISPNPSSGQFAVLNLQFTVGGIIDVYNILGEKVYSQTINLSARQAGSKQQTINCKLNPGIYFVRISNDEHQWTEKIVVE